LRISQILDDFQPLSAAHLKVIDNTGPTIGRIAETKLSPHQSTQLSITLMLRASKAGHSNRCPSPEPYGLQKAPFGGTFCK
jgi:hypothetical protein